MLRYACDGNETQEPDGTSWCQPSSSRYEAWLGAEDGKLAALASTKWILSINGSGYCRAHPSEWNPHGDIVVFLRAADQPRWVTVGKKRIAASGTTQRGWTHFRVPHEVWSHAERRRRPEDGLPKDDGVWVLPFMLTFAELPSQTVLLLTCYGE